MYSRKSIHPTAGGDVNELLELEVWMLLCYGLEEKEENDEKKS